MRLKSLIGNDAFWLPPRLWSYAAENQPDGDFTDYTPGEIGMLLGYTGDAPSMLEALHQAGFMNGMRIHDWDEHNEYHHNFSERAKKAAAARWGKEESTKEERDDKKGKEKKGPSITQALLKHASSINGSYSKAFDEFWREYPKKVGKGDAWKSWKKIHPDESLTSKMLVAVRFQKDCDQWKKDNGQFIPNPATWLNRAQWEDEPQSASTSKPSYSFEFLSKPKPVIRPSYEDIKAREIRNEA